MVEWAAEGRPPWLVHFEVGEILFIKTQSSHVFHKMSCENHKATFISTISIYFLL